MLDFGTDKYGLNAYLFDSTNDGVDGLRQGPLLDRRRAVPHPMHAAH